MTKDELHELLLESLSSYKFIAAPEGFWIDGDDNLLEISRMDYNHRKNSKAYLEKRMENIRRGDAFSGADIDMTEEEYPVLKQYTIELAEQKLKEL